MHFDPPLVSGTLLRRYKRFLADVQLDDGRLVTAHCPNPGSMRTCAEPGWRVWLSPASSPKRKLAWTWEIVLAGDAQTPVLINTARPNGVVRQAIEAGRIRELAGYETLRAEVKYGDGSRIDLLLEDPRDGGPPCYVEVKNATLATGPGRVGFPDSVTVRGTKHMLALAAQVNAGDRAVLFFLVSRSDAEQMHPADEIDPRYGQALRMAVDAGVEVIAYRAVVTRESLGIGPRIPVLLD